MVFSHFRWSGTVAQSIAGYDKTVRYQITSPPAIIKSSTQCRAALEGIEWKTPKLVSSITSLKLGGSLPLTESEPSLDIAQAFLRQMIH